MRRLHGKLLEANLIFEHICARDGVFSVFATYFVKSLVKAVYFVIVFVFAASVFMIADATVVYVTFTSFLLLRLESE